MENFIEKYAIQPICYSQDEEDLSARFHDIEKNISTNLYHKVPLAYIISKCFIISNFDSVNKVVFPYNPKYGLITDKPVFDKVRGIYINSTVVFNVFDTYEEALNFCDDMNLELLNKKVILSDEMNYKTAYQIEKAKIESIRFKLDYILREVNGLEVSKIRAR